MSAETDRPQVLAVAWKAARPRAGGTQGELLVSGADQAALEWALRLAGRWGWQVCVVSAGPVAADAVLRQALASGADRAVRVELELSVSQQAVAAALVAASQHVGAQWWCCGDRGLQRASGAVPALLAAGLGWSAALGLVEGAPERAPEIAGTEVLPLEVIRRLERGRRERLAVRFPAVISVEAESVSLRRASLPAVLASQQATIAVLPSPPGAALTDSRVRVVGHRPYRPRPNGMAPPAGDSARARIATLGAVYAGRDHAPRQVIASPTAAAAAIIEALHTWGYLDRANTDDTAEYVAPGPERTESAGSDQTAGSDQPAQGGAALPVIGPGS